MKHASRTVTWVASALVCLASCESREPEAGFAEKPSAEKPPTASQFVPVSETPPDEVKSSREARTSRGESAPADAKLQTMIAELDHKIATLEKKISAPLQAPLGTGAYSRGTSLRVSGDGSGESLLEKLRRLETELASATTNVATKNQQIANLNQQRDQAVSTSREASERADYLAHSSESLVAAQQTLTERQEQITSLNAQLATGELQRLRAERRWYQLASEILRLSPEDARDLPGVQSRIRQATREVQDVRSESSTKP